MAPGWWTLQAYETTSVELPYPSVVRFTGHVQLNGKRRRTVEAYEMMMRLLARCAGQDPAKLDDEKVRQFFLHLIRDRQDVPQSIRQARTALTALLKSGTVVW